MQILDSFAAAALWHLLWHFTNGHSCLLLHFIHSAMTLFDPACRKFIHTINCVSQTNLNNSLTVKCLCRPVRLQFICLSVQTYTEGLFRRTLLKGIKWGFFKKIEDIIMFTSMIPVNIKIVRLHLKNIFTEGQRGLRFVTWCDDNHLKLSISKTNELELKNGQKEKTL